MNEPSATSDATASQDSSASPQAEEPQFGAIDIVEAFTAMRHEWRGQTKETRALAEQIQAAVATLESFSVRSAHTPAEETDEVSDDLALRPLIQSLADADHQLTRAIQATTQWEEHRQNRESADATAAKQFFTQMSALGRWFARPLWSFLTQQRAARDQLSAQPVIEGLLLVLGRLRRSMSEHQLERRDTVGQPFDAETMHAIGAITGSTFPAGHVAEQLAPCYLWREQLLRFAEVRVATNAKTPAGNPPPTNS